MKTVGKIIRVLFEVQFWWWTLGCSVSFVILLVIAWTGAWRDRQERLERERKERNPPNSN